MAIHQPNLAHENQLKPLKFQRFKQKVVQKANGISFWAFLLSIFIFISIFYIFNLSPSSLLYTTKFWFFISNALILIIAVDFSASNKQPEIYKEYVEKSMGNLIRFPSIESQYPEWEIAETNTPPHPEKEIPKTNNPRPHPEKEIAKTNIPIPPQKEKNLQETQEEVKEVVVDDVVSESKTRENKMQVVVKDDLKMSIEEPEEKMADFPPQVLDHEEVHKEEKERGTRIGNELNAKEEEGQQEEDKEHDNDDDEFSKMSNEELNRRVEEFIQRFNRQIRIQAAQNRVQQMQRGN